MISIILPAWNEEKYIEKSIKSIMRQTYTNWQLIVVDDGSTDNTANIVENLVQNDKRITFLQPGKIGKVAAYNLASKYVHGSWVYFMGADDELPIDAFEHFLKKVSECNPNEKVALRGTMKVISESKKYNGLVLPRNEKVMNFSGPLTFMSKAMQKSILPIPEDYPNEDTWWTLCIEYFADYTDVVNEITCHYRIHDGNSISRGGTFESFNEKYHKRYVVRTDFLERFKDKLTEEQKAEILDELAYEGFRYNGKTLKLLLQQKIDFKNKMRFVMLSNSFLYKIKKKLDRYMLGW